MSGPRPFPGAHQPKLVRAARAKENFQSQSGICEKQPGNVRLHPNEAGQFIHVVDVIRLYRLAFAEPRGERGDPAEDIQDLHQNKNRENASRLFNMCSSTGSSVLAMACGLLSLSFVVLPENFHIDLIWNFLNCARKLRKTFYTHLQMDKLAGATAQ